MCSWLGINAQAFDRAYAVHKSVLRRSNFLFTAICSPLWTPPDDDTADTVRAINTQSPTTPPVIRILPLDSQPPLTAEEFDICLDFLYSNQLPLVVNRERIMACSLFLGIDDLTVHLMGSQVENMCRGCFEWVTSRTAAVGSGCISAISRAALFLWQHYDVIRFSLVFFLCFSLLCVFFLLGFRFLAMVRN